MQQAAVLMFLLMEAATATVEHSIAASKPGSTLKSRVQLPFMDNPKDVLGYLPQSSQATMFENLIESYVLLYQRK
jgi:hypothetical protein